MSVSYKIDSQNFGNDEKGASVPNSIIYSGKPRTATASKVRHNFLPINGRQFSPANQVHFSIACGKKGAFLDPKAIYLKFKLTNTRWYSLFR